MTGAGSTSEFLFAFEDSFKGTPTDSDSSGTPETYEVGQDPIINEQTLERTMGRFRTPGDAEPTESITEQLEGRLSFEAIVSSDVHAQVEQLVFNSGGTSLTTGRPQSARLYVSSDYLDGTEDRAFIGCVADEYSVEYQENGMVRFSLSMRYANEERDITIPTGEVTRVTTGSSSPHHDFSLSLDGAAVTKLNSASLTLSNLYRFHYGPEDGPEPVDATLADPQPTLDMTAVFDTEAYADDIYGGSATTTPDDTISSFSGTATIGALGTTVSTYNLSSVKPISRQMENLIAADTDTTQALSFHVNDGVTVS